MKILNRHAFWRGLCTLFLALAGLTAGSLGAGTRFFIGGALLALLAAFDFWFSQASPTPPAQPDERDRLIVLASGHAAVRLLNGVLFAACLFLLLGYAVFRRPLLLACALTLCAVLLLLFFLLLAAGRYYENRL